MTGASSNWATKTGRSWALLSFASGTAIHLFLFRWLIGSTRFQGSFQEFANHPLTHAAVGLFGGLYVAWFMVRLLQRTVREEKVSWSRVLIRGCLYGIYATTLTVQTFYLFGSLYLSVQRASWLMPLYFVFIFMGMGTYGMGIILESIPIALGYGFLGGVLVLPVRRYETSQLVPIPLEREKNLGRDSLLAGAMATLFSFVPFVGIVLAVFAVVFGIGALKKSDETRQGRRLAWVGVILGGITIARQLMGIVVYALASSGLI